MWGIIIAPYIFAWVTLRNGYSKYTRNLSVGYAIFFIAFYVVGAIVNGPTSLATRGTSSPSPPVAAAPAVAPPVGPVAAAPEPPMTYAQAEARLKELRGASKDDLHDVNLKKLRAQLDGLPASERASLDSAWSVVLKKSSAVKAKYAIIQANDADRVTVFAMRETIINHVLEGLEGAEGPQIDKARARLAQSMSKVDADRAKVAATRARCGETIVGKASVAYYLKQRVNDPKGLEVERCSTPVLTEQCWQVRCEFFFKNGFGARIRQTANFYAEGNTVVDSDAQ